MTADFFSAEDFREHTNWHHAALAETANRLLRERAQVVYGKMGCGPQFSERQWLFPLSEHNIPIGSTHTALLICVTPIARDSADALVEALAKLDHRFSSTKLSELIDRARALKAGGK